MRFEGNESGIPRRRERLPGKAEIAAAKAEGREANAARNDKLRHKKLSRRARSRNLELRHSSYGYSLIDRERNRIDGRNDMTLTDVEAYLSRI